LSIKDFISGSKSFGQSIYLFKIKGKTYASLIPGNGTFPVNILKMIQPSAHKSDAQVDSHSLISSGARKLTVPTKVPLRSTLFAF
jgi:hypothetical protein